MPRNASFWRNAAIVGAIHAVVLLGLARWSGSAKKPTPTDIVWTDAGSAAAAVANSPAQSPARLEEEQPSVADDEATSSESPTEIELPPPSPTPPTIPSPTATPKPTVTAKPSPKSLPTPTPKKALIAKASPTPSRKPPASTKLAKIEAPTKIVAATPRPVSPETKQPSGGESGGNASASDAGGRGSGTRAASQFGWYGEMLHKRFFSEWVQPTSVGMKGAKMSTGVRVRIEKDGRVSDFALVRPSGNVVVDESVAAVAKRVLRVDPPPFALAEDHYDVNINFELDPQ